MSGAGGSRLKNRLVLYFGGFFVMTLGIAISVKSDLGVSPVSSIPYTITCVFGLEMGKATILFRFWCCARRSRPRTCYRLWWASSLATLPPSVTTS